ASAGDGPKTVEQWIRQKQKMMPVKPPEQPSVGIDDSLPGKPAASRAAIAADSTSWTVTLTASSTSLFPGQGTILTATANHDVQSTPYKIKNWDSKYGVYVASCGFGTTCTTASPGVMRANVDFTSFTAVVADGSGHTVAWSFLDVYWHGAGIMLTET